MKQILQFELLSHPACKRVQSKKNVSVQERKAVFLFVCVSELKSVGGSISGSPSTILPSEERDRDEKQKKINLEWEL